MKTPGVVRGNTWYLRNSNTSGFADLVFTYGSASDIPVVGDWDGNGTDTPGVTREHITFSPPDQVLITNNTWHLRNSNSTGFADVTLTFSFPGQPVAGDWDGDGDDGIGMVVHNTNRWELDQDLDGAEDIELFFGKEMGDSAIAGDWDGDETESVGVVRGNTWFLKNENSSGFADSSFQYGSAADFPLVWGQSST